MQKGLSENTALAYADDVAKLTAYLSDAGINVEDVTYDILQNFMAALFDLGIAERSRRRIVSGVRSFFRCLRQEGLITDDPTLLLEAPK